MLSLFLCALQAPVAGPDGEPGSADGADALRSVTWQEFCLEVFQPALALPMPTDEEVGDQPRDLAAWFAEWLATDLALAPGEEPEEGHQPVLIGDLVAELQPLRDNTLRLERQLLLRTAQLPGLAPAGRERLRELLSDATLRSDDWEPDDNLRDDGLLHLPSWEMDEDTAGAKVWQDRSGDGTVLRTAVLLNCELDAWFAVENDADAYFRFVDNRFEEVEIVEGSEAQSETPAGEPVEGRSFRVVSDLPFPFGDYEAVTPARVIFRQDGTVLADVYSTSDDFHWFAGRDVFLPVNKADGERVAWLCVQEFGFDLDNVPEREKDRKAGVRMTLGNKKRMAEALQATSLEE